MRAFIIAICCFNSFNRREVYVCHGEKITDKLNDGQLAITNLRALIQGLVEYISILEPVSAKKMVWH